MATTFEEAKRCPRCNQPGEDRKVTPSRNSEDQIVDVHHIYCVVRLCEWYDTPWLVQINPDGSIPEAYSQVGEKKFPTLSPETETRIRESLEAQLKAEVRPGSEVRNPYSR